MAYLFFSVTIETIQFFNKIGVFEIDDILGNILGAQIGLGLYSLLYYFSNQKKSADKNIGICRLLLRQIPLVAVLLSYTILLLVYWIKPLGNNKNNSCYGFNPQNIAIISDISLGSIIREVNLYKTDVLDLEKATKVAENKMSQYELDWKEKIVDVFEDKVYLHYGTKTVPEKKSQKALPHIAACKVSYRGGFYECVFSNGALGNEKQNILKTDLLNDKSIKAVLDIINENIPDNSIVFGKSPNLIIKTKTEEEIKFYTKHIWGWY